MKKSVVFFCPTFSSGGVEKVLINLANYFCVSYNTSFLVCRNLGNLETLLDPQIKVDSLNTRIGTKCLIRLVSFFSRREADFVVCGPQFINIFAVVALKIILKKKTRVILTHHNFLDSDITKLRLLYKPLISFFYRRADIVIAVSNAVAKHLISDIGLPQNKIKVIYNPVIDKGFIDMQAEQVDHEWFNDTAKSDFKILICVGRLSPVKNQSWLVSIFPRILERINCKLLLLGEGSEYDKLMGLIDRNNLNNSVEVMGSVSNPAKYIKRADLLLLPSLSETFSLVAVEALTLGVPVLSSPTQGVKEILGSFEGCYFDDLSCPEKFAAKIVDILSHSSPPIDPSYLKEFHVDSIGRKYEELLELLQ